MHRTCGCAVSSPHYRTCGEQNSKKKFCLPFCPSLTPRQSFPQARTIFFSLKKRNQKCKNEERNDLSPRCGEGHQTCALKAGLPKDYHTALAELETNDLLRVRRRRRLAQSDCLCCVYGWGVQGCFRTDPEHRRTLFLECSVSCVRPTGWMDF